MTPPRFAMPPGEPQRGGCPDCDAEQVLSEWSPGVLRLEVRHDATCPTWRAMLRRARPDRPDTTN